MKLKNKKTGEIFDGDVFSFGDINSLAELNEEWEDYEEPKTFWYMTAWGDVKEYSQDQFAVKQKQAIGNYFETKEEAEKAVEKLKSWKRLKEKGFFFDGRTPVHDNTVKIRARVGVPFLTDELSNDLDLLFGGE